VNDNPNAPETVTANLYLPPMLHWVATGPQFDGRFIGRYTQEWVLPIESGSSPNFWTRMGYQSGSDNAAQQWRDVYWTLGQNLVDLINLAEAEERWDVLGVGYVLKAWGWLTLTSLHGEIIIQQAFDVTRFQFDYDTQEFAYQEVVRLLDEAIANLQRDDGAVDVGYLAVGDEMYNGDRSKWLMLAYGLKAQALNHFSNKSTYDPAEVIAMVEQSFTSNADDALFTYPGTHADNGDKNFWGRTRSNLIGVNFGVRQSQFVLELMNGTQFGGVVDPRMSRMLAPSPDGEFRGLDPNTAPHATANRPNNLHGYPGNGGTGEPGQYLFDDKSKIPVLTYSQLQFIKAEAALRMGSMGTARTAYLEGISSHIDFVNARNAETGNLTVTQISSAERTAFLASPEIDPPTLTLSHIMSQKYIAQWAWGHNELWMDMRRYHYTDMDPVSGTQVFRGFTIPENLDSGNGQPVQRLRPRYNSEYVWNQAGLEPIGGLDVDYHTKLMWITEQ
jgi:hypothetical protein